MRYDDPTEPGELIRYGVIASVDRAARRCTVAAGGVVTGPIRWLAGRAGATRIFSAPSVGEQVVLLCPDGELAGAIALLGVECETHLLPGDDSADVVAFGDGATIGYDPVGHVFVVSLPADAKIRLVASGGTTIQGDVAIEGKLAVSSTIVAEGDVTGAGVRLSDHRHELVRAGTDLSGTPAR